MLRTDRTVQACLCAVVLLSIAVTALAEDEASVRKAQVTSNSNAWYVQYHFGFASDADFGPSLLLLVDQSRERSTLHSISVGKQLSDSFYGRDLDVSVHVGLQYFDERNFQSDIIGTTAYWRLSKHTTFPFTHIPIKVSLAQGLSYVDDIPTAEVRDFDPDQSSELTHYLEYGFHYSFRNSLVNRSTGLSQWFKDINVGYSIFHRSSFFGLFADIPGGINFPGIAVEFVLR